MKQLPLAIGLPPQPSFDNFVAGANAAALAQLRAVAPQAAASSSTLPPPVYLWGAAGSGKTHLLQALAAQTRAQGQVVASFDADDPLPWLPGSDASLFVVDRCEALDAGRQHAAFTLFVAAAAQGAQVAAAGRLPPVDLPLRDDLRTRLAWGHVHAIEPLGDAQTCAALRREAGRRGLVLPDDVIDHLLNRHARDLGSLMRLLDQVDDYALAMGRRVTLPLLRAMLAETALPARGSA